MAEKGWFGLPTFGLPTFGLKPRPNVVSCTLSGGGSRAGFQLGALDYLYRHDEEFAPTVFVGTSAGSILAAALSQSADRDGQQTYLRRLINIWQGLKTQGDMFTARPWYQTLETEGPSWLELVKPAKPEPPKRPSRLPFLRPPAAPAEPSVVEPPSPLELALSPDEEFQSEWSLATLSAVAGQLGKLPRLGTELNNIALGLEHTRSMYRPGPVLAQLLETETFDPERVAESGVTLRISMVSLETGELRYMTQTGALVDRENQPIDDTTHNLAVGVLASCAIPAVFRPVPIGDETYIDGGARENLPAELAVGHLGARRNYIVSSQSMGVQRRASMADIDLFATVMRATEILIDEAGRDELAYAISTGSPVIYPELSIHDAMTVNPSLIAINMDYGWLRAAEVHLEMDERKREQHRHIIELRLRILDLEERFLALEKPSRRDHMVLRSAKVELRDAVRAAHTTPLPDGAEHWWTQWERHPEPPTMQPPWMPMPTRG